MQASSLDPEESKKPLFVLPSKIVSDLELEEIFHRINRYAKTYFNAEIGLVGIIQGNKILIEQGSIEGETPAQTPKELPLSEIGNGLTRQAYNTGKIVSEENCNENFSGEETEFTKRIKETGLIAKMVIPLSVNDAIIALIIIGKRSAYTWNQKDYLYAEQIRALAVLAITNTQNYHNLNNLKIELEARNRVLETLMEFNRRLRGPIELTPTADRGLMLTMEIVNAEVGILHLLNEANPNQLNLFLSRNSTPITESGINSEFPHWAKDIKLGYGPVGRAIKAKRSLVINELNTISKIDPSDGLNSGMFVPLLVGDNLIGTISLLSRHPHHFTEQQVLFTETIAGQIATAIQQVSRIELRREQERLSAVLALARTAAHDLNQPLQVLQAELELITGMGEPLGPDTFQTMLVAVKDMASKIKEYQKIVRVETTEQVPGIRVIDRSRSLPPPPEK